MNQNNAMLPEAAIAALKKGDRIEAVKLTRAANGLDLTEAKQAVDAYLKANPQTMKRAHAERSTGGGMIALILLGLALVIAYFLLDGAL